MEQTQNSDCCLQCTQFRIYCYIGKANENIRMVEATAEEGEDLTLLRLTRASFLLLWNAERISENLRALVRNTPTGMRMRVHGEREIKGNLFPLFFFISFFLYSSSLNSLYIYNWLFSMYTYIPLSRLFCSPPSLFLPFAKKQSEHQQAVAKREKKRAKQLRNDVREKWRRENKDENKKNLAAEALSYCII